MAAQAPTFLHQLGEMLHVHYSSAVDDSLPQLWVELITALHERERACLGEQRQPTDQELRLRHLMIADRHIAGGERRVAEQRIRISRLHVCGLDTSDAEWLLGQFEEILREMLRHKQIMLQNIHQAH